MNESQKNEFKMQKRKKKHFMKCKKSQKKIGWEKEKTGEKE